MSEEEVRRAGVLKRVKAGELSQVEAPIRILKLQDLARRLYELNAFFADFPSGGR